MAKNSEIQKAAFVCTEFTDAWRTYMTAKNVPNARDLVNKGQAYLDIQKSTGTQMYPAERAQMIVWTAEQYLESNASSDGLTVEKGDVFPSYINKHGHKVTVIRK